MIKYHSTTKITYTNNIGQEVTEEFFDERQICDQCISQYPTGQGKVVCPICGYYFYITGMGNDGILCKGCGTQYIPNTCDDCSSAYEKEELVEKGTHYSIGDKSTSNQYDWICGNCGRRWSNDPFLY